MMKLLGNLMMLLGVLGAIYLLGGHNDLLAPRVLESHWAPFLGTCLVTALGHLIRVISD